MKMWQYTHNLTKQLMTIFSKKIKNKFKKFLFSKLMNLKKILHWVVLHQ